MAVNQHDPDAPADSGTEPLHASPEDTGESSSLQAQEGQAAENIDTLPPPNKPIPPHKKPVPGSQEAVKDDLGIYLRDLNDYLAWKEDLRVTSIDLQIGGPYFELWTKEANLFFRRLVILKKRMASIQKQKRA